MDDLIECPFCHEKEFDLIGLKIHISKDYCQIYPKINLPKSAMEIFSDIAKETSGKPLKE